MANGDEFTGTLDEEGRKHGQGTILQLLIKKIQL
jgi:hypothetical protein